MSKPKKENNFGHYTIKEMVSKKINKSFFLADIQREYRWDEERVEKLFDSILKGYPIGTCLALKQKGQEASNLYTFIKEVEKDKCVGCGMCNKACSMGLDVRQMVVDSSILKSTECIQCGACVDGCPKKALSYKWTWRR